MITNRTYNPCDDCQYSYSKTGEESSMCKICEFTYFKNLAPKRGKWLTGKYSFDRSVCSLCGATFEGDGGNYCCICGARMTEDDNEKM